MVTESTINVDSDTDYEEVINDIDNEKSNQTKTQSKKRNTRNTANLQTNNKRKKV